MRKQVLILEDDSNSAKEIETVLKAIDEDIIVYEADSLQRAYHIAIECHIHLFIVDIILNPSNSGDISGLGFVQELRKIKKYEYVPVIFVSSLEDPKLFSYSQLYCLGYIEKPFERKQLEKYVLRALQFPVAEDEDRYIFFRADGLVYSKRIGEICYFEISRRCIKVHCTNDELVIPYKTCEELIKEIDSPLFVQCSRFCIINKKFIEYIDYRNRYVKLKNFDKLLEIGSCMKSKFKKEMEYGYNCC